MENQTKKKRQNLRKLYPHKYAARSMVRNAIILGILTRPDHCEECKTKCKPQGHHEIYQQPLNVLWLCQACHTKLHQKRNGHGK